jgi:predicted metal-dependent hydrolase
MQQCLPFDSPLVRNGQRPAQGKPFEAPTLLAQFEVTVLPVRPSGPDPTNPPGLRDPGALAPSTQRAPRRAPVPSTQRAVTFVRHPRARQYVLRVTDDGTVRVTIPRWGSKREAAAFAARQQAWIEKQQRRVEAQHLVRAEEERCGERPSAIELRARRDRAKRELPVRLLELAAEHKLTVTRVSIRNQRWRWGSCSRSGHICLNWRLVQMPAPVRDYVLIHELMHLKRMDHSPRFWKLVAAACPEYKKARAWLRSQSAR